MGGFFFSFCTYRHDCCRGCWACRLLLLVEFRLELFCKGDLMVVCVEVVGEWGAVTVFGLDD